MGAALGCTCDKDTGDVRVPSSDCKIDSPEPVENSPIKQTIVMKSQRQEQFNISARETPKIIKIQSAYKKHFTQSKFAKLLISMKQLFDTNILNFAELIQNDNKNGILNSYINDNVKQIEESIGSFVPSSKELSQYHFIFDRDAYKFKDSNCIYKGNWNYKGKKHGFGSFIDAEGNKYTGFWKEDKFNGRGRYIDKNGNCFEGTWKDGIANGEGKLIMKNGYKYEGNWENDFQQGKGKETYTDGSVFEGNFIKGVKEGHGEYTWKDGSKYNGNFDNGNINGEGEFTWSDGRKYKGTWINGQMNGKGEFRWPNGNRYVGEYKQSRKDGTGSYYWSDTVYYEGTWLNNSQHGEGTYYDNGNIIKGIFRYGKLVKSDSHQGGGMINNESKGEENHDETMQKTMKEYMGNGGSIIPEVQNSFRSESE